MVKKVGSVNVNLYSETETAYFEDFSILIQNLKNKDNKYNEIANKLADDIKKLQLKKNGYLALNKLLVQFLNNIHVLLDSNLSVNNKTLDNLMNELEKNVHDIQYINENFYVVIPALVLVACIPTLAYFVPCLPLVDILFLAFEQLLLFAFVLATCIVEKQNEEIHNKAKNAVGDFYQNFKKLHPELNSSHPELNSSQNDEKKGALRFLKGFENPHAAQVQEIEMTQIYTHSSAKCNLKK